MTFGLFYVSSAVLLILLILDKMDSSGEMDTINDTTQSNDAQSDSSSTILPKATRKRRKAAKKIDEYFDRITRQRQVYFKCKLPRVNDDCDREYKGPGTSGAL